MYSFEKKDEDEDIITKCGNCECYSKPEKHTEYVFPRTHQEIEDIL